MVKISFKNRLLILGEKMTKKKKHAVRSKIHSELKNFHVDVDTKRSQYKPDENRYDIQIEKKKFEKLKREEEKTKNYHIKNRKKLRNRWELEDELTESFEETNQ